MYYYKYDIDGNLTTRVRSFGSAPVPPANMQFVSESRFKLNDYMYEDSKLYNAKFTDSGEVDAEGEIIYDKSADIAAGEVSY